MCGIVGIAGVMPVNQSIYDALTVLQHRGQDAAGIITIDANNCFRLRKANGLVSDVFEARHMQRLQGNMGIGHVRYPTAGSSSASEAQPFYVNSPYGITLAHNGNLTNAAEIRHNLEQQGTIFQTSIDSEVIVNFVARSHKETIEERIIESLKMVKGCYCLAIMTEEKLIGARDPQGFRPLCIGKTEEGSWILSSETCGLDVVGAEFVRDVLPGEMVVIDQDGLKSYPFATDEKKAGCIFEHIYFARPDSVIDGQSVHEARFLMGRELARESGFKGDIVISVPDSGTTAATGFAYESGIPFVEGLIKNRYIGRTFIQPTQKKRDTAVKLKLNAIRSVVEGKSVIMVDDSIVRGTTSGKIVRMLRNAGAKAVHVCISSPPIGYPCFYGIDTSVRKELIAATKSVEEIREFIGADSLHFLSIDGLKRCVPNLNAEDMCYACFNSAYPIKDGAKPAGDSKYVFEQRKC